jgi:tRNA threonylcarbamoyladenosine biosynthesis protein TsaB
MLTLALETSGPLGSIALQEEGHVLGDRMLELGRRHGQALVSEIGRLFAACGKSPRDCRLVAISIGPGSFTGLRVGVTCAKTLAYATGCQVVAVDTLHAIACNSPADVASIQVVSDAQRGNLFIRDYTRSPTGEWVAQGAMRIASASSWVDALVPDNTVTGPALEKYGSLVAGRCRIVEAEFRVPRAATVARLALKSLASHGPIDPWTLEPLYFGPSSAEIQWKKLGRK